MDKNSSTEDCEFVPSILKCNFKWSKLAYDNKFVYSPKKNFVFEVSNFFEPSKL